MLAHRFVQQHNSLSLWFHNISPVYKECNKVVHILVLAEQPDVRTFLQRLFREKWAFPPMNLSEVITPDYISSIKLMESCSSGFFKMGLRWDGFSCPCKVSSMCSRKPFFLKAGVTPRPAENCYGSENVPIIQVNWTCYRKKVMENLPVSHDIKAIYNPGCTVRSHCEKGLGLKLLHAAGRYKRF